MRRTQVVPIAVPVRSLSAKLHHLIVPRFERVADPRAILRSETTILRPMRVRVRAIRATTVQLAPIHATRQRTSLSQARPGPSAIATRRRLQAVTLIRLKPSVPPGLRRSFGVHRILDLETRAPQK